tara:strand:+ start:46 stop:1233 length:1188 start_codon:yes stop_codon:yes gene_type:complete
MYRINSIRNWAIVLFAGTILLGAGPATADPTPQQLMELIQQQQRAIEKLQKKLEETQAAQAAAGSGSKSDGGSDFISENKLKIGGELEIEATNNESFTADTTSSDLALAKATLYFEAQPHEMLQTYIAGVFNDGTASIDLDEGWVKFGETDDVPAYVKAGNFVVPFGAFNTNMLADPLGLTLAETAENPVQVGYSVGGLSGSVFAFNGDTQEIGEGDHFNKFGANLAYSTEVSGASLDLGLSYINAIGESDTIEGAMASATAMSGDNVSGIGLNAMVTSGPFTAIFEYIAATDDFDSGDVAFNGNNAQPEAYQFEVGYTTSLLEKELVLAATYQTSEESQALGIAEKQYGVAATYSYLPGLDIGVEFMHQEDYSSSDGGTGLDGHNATLKLMGSF